MFSESDMHEARSTIADLTRHATQLMRDSRAAQEQLAAVQGTAGNAHVDLTVSASGQIESLEFTSAASSAALSELSRSVMDAYHRACSQANHGTVGVLREHTGDAELTSSVEQAVPSDVTAIREQEENR